MDDNELKEKAAKWDALNDEINKFYLDESGRWSEKSSIKKHDFAEIGLMVAKFVGWEDKEMELNNKQKPQWSKPNYNPCKTQRTA